MKDRIKDFFAFNKKEQRGLIALLVLMLLALSANIFMPYLVPVKQFDMDPFREDVENFLATVAYQDSVYLASKPVYKEKPAFYHKKALETFLDSPFYFNPDELTGQQWLTMGMDETVVKNMLRYKEKGGKFNDYEDVKKIYGMTDSVFSILQPYLQFKPQSKEENKYKTDPTKLKYNNIRDSLHKYPAEDIRIIELNTADSASLLALKGIGPSFAGRIIRYRERLGGFYSTSQLLEIKGMDTMRFNQFQNQVITDSLLIRKIDINTVIFKDLLKHPYFEYYLVKAIFNYKDNIRQFDSVGQIRDLPVMYEELYQKIGPYLEVK